MVDYKKLAKELSPKIKPHVLEAVARVESQGSGFMPTGEPKILFEPHVFWRSLIKAGLNPNKFVKGNEDILYAKWRTGNYGKITDQHTKLQRAVAINRAAALMACSWGAFQVLGENYKDLGYPTIQAFVNEAYTEEGQCRLFVRFVKANHLTDELENEMFTDFARAYNGIGFEKNKYDVKMKELAEELKSKQY